MRGVVFVVVLGLGLGVAGGCKKAQTTTTPTTKPAKEAPVVEAPKLTVRVKAEAHGNAGRPFYAVVRTVVLKDFVEDQYDDIATLVIAPDETVLASFLVFPGRSSEVAIAKPKGSVGVYCLLTEASGTSWKRLYRAPEVIEVVAGRDRLLDDE